VPKKLCCKKLLYPIPGFNPIAGFEMRFALPERIPKLKQLGRIRGESTTKFTPNRVCR
jgi:hypothetical protein